MRGWTAVGLALALASCARQEPAPVPEKPAPAPAPAPAPPPAPALTTGTLPGDRLPAFTVKVRRADGAGASETVLDTGAPKGTTVLVIMSTTCPYCAEAVGALRAAEDAFRPRGVEFVYLYPMKAESAEEKAAWHAKMGFRAGQVIDADASAARLLKADRTPTAYLVDARGVLLYRGAVLEGAEEGGPPVARLADALGEHLAGKAISVPSAEPAG